MLPYKTISPSQLVQLVNECKGSTFFGCSYVSPHKQKVSSPYKNVLKYQTIGGAFNWDYAKAVRKATDNPEFNAKAHSWAIKTEDGQTVKFGNWIANQQLQLRLQLHVRNRKRKSRYTTEVDGKRVDVTYDQLKPYNYAPPKPDTNPTQVRSFSLENMLMVRINGQRYVVWNHANNPTTLDYIRSVIGEPSETYAMV